MDKQLKIENCKLQIAKSAIRNPQSATCHGVVARRNRIGFTIIELLVVIMIISILIALGTGAAVGLMGRADREKTIAIQKTIMEAVETYRDDTDEYPSATTTAELYVLLRDNSAAKKILENLPAEAIYNNTTFHDGYENEMDYKPTEGFGGRPRLVSKGKDGETGTADTEEDDIHSDKE